MTQGLHIGICPFFKTTDIADELGGLVIFTRRPTEVQFHPIPSAVACVFETMDAFVGSEASQTAAEHGAKGIHGSWPGATR
jgi:hypothetical protein